MAKPFFVKHLKRFANEINVEKSVLEAFEELNSKYKLAKKSDIYPYLFETGDSVGKILERSVPIKYTKNSKSKYTFAFGKNEKTDLDTICNENSYFSSEYKSTSQKRNTPIGTSTHINFGDISIKHEKDEYSFYVFSPYKFVYETSDDLCVPRFIAIGMLKPSDWFVTGENGNGATISTETFIDQFMLVWVNPSEKFTLKSPELNLEKINISNGDILSLCGRNEIIVNVTVFNAKNNLVSYYDVKNNLHILTLKEATKKFGKKSYIDDIKKHWIHNDKTLTEINSERYKMTYLNAA